VTMAVTAVALAVLAVCLIGPVSHTLAQARWVRREPKAALVLWHAVGLAAGLAALGASAAVALAPLGGGLLGATFTWLSSAVQGDVFSDIGVGHSLLLIATFALGFRLVGTLALNTWRTLRARRRHRTLVDLVGRPWPKARGGRVLDHPEAVAYCLPGLTPRVVLTSGALKLLDEEEVAAVLAHERAHLEGRHDLSVLTFGAWAAALPWFPGVRRARRAVQALVEMVADDRASAVSDRTALASALARFGASRSLSTAPLGALAAADVTTLERVQRLLNPPPPARLARVGAYVSAVLLVAAPTLALLATA